MLFLNRIYEAVMVKQTISYMRFFPFKAFRVRRTISVIGEKYYLY